jgi:5S rRNA maturation endonuclease (ribonuclease M5)
MFGCERHDKFGILFTNDGGGLVKCMRCGESTSLFNYLVFINRRDLIEGYSVPSKDNLLEIEQEAIQDDTEATKVELPYKYKRLYYDDYLDSRGFTERQYNVFKVGSTEDMRMKNHIVFPIYQKGELVTWLARSRYSKEWHKKNIEDYKNGVGRLVLRYYNASGTEFSEILGGYDEIRSGKDKTVIIVEGITDKASIDRNLDLYDKGNTTKCCFTFGKNLSEKQVKLLIEKSVENIILMYDPDAIEEIEKFSMNYLNKFKNIQCARLKDRDPGDMDREEIEEVMSNLRSPIEFYFNNIKSI